jgi:Bacteriophage replication gene A protein (GPA).
VSKGSLQLQLDSLHSVDKEFYEFLQGSENAFIRIDGCDVVNGGWKTKTISGLHRWKTAYKKRIYAKLCQLNPWYEKHHLPITMVTFTTRQRGFSIREQIDLLKHSFNKAKKLLNKYLGKFPYFWIMEPHKSGYGHIHMLIFKNVPRSIRYNLAEAWSSSYGAGGYKRALTFSMSKSQHSLRSAGAYVFKYIEKTLDYDLLSHPDSGYFKLSAWVWKMSRHDNEYTGVRFWGCSRDLSEVMAYSAEVDTSTIWWRVSLWHDANDRYPAGWFPVWIDDDIAAYPDRVYDFDAWLSSLGGYPENLSSSSKPA